LTKHKATYTIRLKVSLGNIKTGWEVWILKKEMACGIELKELKGKIRASEYGTYRNLAPEIPMSVSTLSLKLNGKSDFTAWEISRLCTLLKIPKEEVLRYFFPSMFPRETLSA